jgi:hypothetical protein
MPSLPFILAGPIVRRVEPHACSFWIALRDRGTVTATAWLSQQFSGASGALATGSATTRQFGQNLHIAVVTVPISSPAVLPPGQVVSYDISCNGRTLAAEGLLKDQAAAGDDPGHKALGYAENRLPSFVMPAGALAALRLAHASCRKTSGPGFDALAWLDDHISVNLNNPAERPQ